MRVASFHELGHGGVHMKLIAAEFLPMKMLPRDRSLTEGIGEIFTLPLRDRRWLSAVLPSVTTEQLDEYEHAVTSFEAVASRHNWMHALLESALFEGIPLEQPGSPELAPKGAMARGSSFMTPSHG